MDLLLNVNNGGEVNHDQLNLYVKIILDHRKYLTF